MGVIEYAWGERWINNIHSNVKGEYVQISITAAMKKLSSEKKLTLWLLGQSNLVST